MEQSLGKNIELKDRILSFCRRNKYKIYFFITILIITIISFTFLNTHKKNNNKKIAEKYVQAGIYLSAGKKETAQKIYEEIILSKNKFYSILALNALIEKKLINDNDKILEYFNLTRSLNISQSQKDLIDLKKALYLIKIKNQEKGHLILKNLIDQNSTLSPLAKELFDK